MRSKSGSQDIVGNAMFYDGEGMSCCMLSLSPTLCTYL